MIFTKEQWEEQNRRVPFPGASISTIPKASSQSLAPSPAPSKISSTSKLPPSREELRWGKGMNKTEWEYLNLFLLSRPQIWSMVEREAFKMRIGPLDQRCYYTPDFSGVHFNTTVSISKFALVEVKGAYEYEDSTVKRKAAAKWCLDRNIGFLFAQKTKAGWNETWLA